MSGATGRPARLTRAISAGPTGSTGAGKSTALALLHRVFDPQSGSVKIDGMDVRAIKLAALRRNIGVVFQEVLLFNRTIAENLRVGRPEASDEELVKSAVAAQAHDFIMAQPNGYDTLVGERGRDASRRLERRALGHVHQPLHHRLAAHAHEFGHLHDVGLEEPALAHLVHGRLGQADEHGARHRR